MFSNNSSVSERDRVKSPAGALQPLQATRRHAEAALATTGDFGAAFVEVCDELIRRTQVIVDQYPEDEAMTLRLINEMPAVVDALAAILRTAHALSEVTSEGAAALEARRDPIMKFVARVKSEGFKVAEDWTVTDTRDPRLPDTADPGLRVQREAEAITRAERATAYHERLTSMAAGFENARNEYTQRIRNVIGTVLDG